jgi:hypothetical protein
MNRRDFLKGLIVIAASSPLAAISSFLPKKELYTPSSDTFVNNEGMFSLDPEYFLFDLRVPHNIPNDEEYIDFYAQDPDGYIQYIGSGTAGTTIPGIPMPNYPFRLLVKSKIPDKTPIRIDPISFRVTDDNTTLLKVFKQPLQIISRQIIV